MPRKEVRIDDETVVFHQDASGSTVVAVEHRGQRFDKPPDFRKTDRLQILMGGVAVNLPAGSVVITKVNPTCVYYFYGGVWWTYCY